MVEAIFFDIDGTLVSFKTHKIPSSTIDALHQLQAKGIKLFIATGRGKEGLEILNQFEFDGYITLNGQYCYDKSGHIIYENGLHPKDMETIVEYVEKNQIPCAFKEEHDQFYNFKNELVEELHAITNNDNHPLGDIKRAINHKIYQVTCFVDLEKEAEILKLCPHTTSSRWFHSFCDLSPLGGTKHNGIVQVCKHLNIDIKNTMGFGDGGNDVPMLQCVNLSIAMGNACDELKSIADFVTKDVDDDGISYALKHFDLI